MSTLVGLGALLAMVLAGGAAIWWKAAAAARDRAELRTAQARLEAIRERREVEEEELTDEDIDKLAKKWTQNN